MSTPGATPFSTVRGIAETIVALPYQLGYRPERSLVVICLEHHPDRTRQAIGLVTMTARADLDPPGGAEVVLGAVAAALSRAAPDVVCLLAFEGAKDDATALLHAASTLAELHGVGVDRAVRVRDGAWRPLEPDGTDPVWRALPAEADVPVVAEYVLQGRSPLRKRSELAALLTTSRPVLTAAAGADLARRTVGATAAIIPRNDEAAVATLAAVLSAPGEALPAITGHDLADLVAASFDVPLRDAILARLAPGVLRVSDTSAELAGLVGTLPVLTRRDGHAGRRMARLAALAPRPWAAPLLSVCGYLAWWSGDGTMANLAVERALSVDPGYSLAVLLDQALQQAMPPPGQPRPPWHGQGSPAA